VRLNHPEPAALIGGHGDRLDQPRLTGHQANAEALGNCHALGRLVGGYGCVLGESADNGRQEEEETTQKSVHGGVARSDKVQVTPMATVGVFVPRLNHFSPEGRAASRDRPLAGPEAVSIIKELI
jgi:hypothetical protein